MSRYTTIMAIALALGAGACGKKKSKAKGAEGSGSGSVAVVKAGDADPAATLPTVITSTTPQQAVEAKGRPPEDVALDAWRRPAELFTFLGIGRGMKVAELMTGGGYTAEFLARLVGAEGVVYAQNPKDVLEKFAEKPWSARLERLKDMPWLVRVDQEMADPLPAEAKDLDLVVMHLVYHDTVAMGVDRAQMNAAVWRALKPGAMYAIIDHTAKAGSGEQAAKDLHRIDPKFVEAEVAKAGFMLDRTSTMFANPQDTMDWNAAPPAAAAAEKRGTSDRFVMVFRKQTGQ